MADPSIETMAIPRLRRFAASLGMTVLLMMTAILSRSLSLLAIALLATACDRTPAVRVAEASTTDSVARVERERARQDSIVRSRPGYVIDSILPVAEEIRRFQATLDSHPTALGDGATSRTALVTQFVRALERNDTASLAKLVVSRAEFGHLIYPTSPNIAPPYRQSPELVWLTRSASTEKATSRLLHRFGGKPFGYAGFSCDNTLAREGANTLSPGCAVRFIEPGRRDTTRLRMFGSIVERDGRFKFLSLTNGL